ncbi:MAG TPA: FecR domain-containing protein [Bryobacteraceae bacterium]|nr:FecR domain-containing protein [Bryobacteraceae bacterium]
MALLVCAFAVQAQTTPVVARASSVSGRALLFNAGANGAAFGLSRGVVLNPGDRIDTRGGGRVVIDLSDGSMVVVQPESVIVLKDFQQASSLRELFEITLGIVRVKINHFAGRPNPYRMNSPTASIAVRGTEFSIEVGIQGDTQVVVYEGAVEVSSLNDPDRKTLIEAGRGVLVQAGQDFHLIGNVLNRVGDMGGHGDSDDHHAAPVAAMANAGGGAAPPPMPVQPTPQPPSPSHGSGAAPHDRDDASLRATASTYDRYIAGLSDIEQVPFLFRYNAFPEAHLDSLENPAYATGFTSAEGRVFVLPTFSGVQGLQQYQSTFGPGGTLPGDYSLSPQFSLFTPIGRSGFTIGGSVSASRVGSTGISAMPNDDPTMFTASNGYQPSTSGTSTGTFYSGALVAARRFGANSLGFEIESLKGTGSLISTTTQPGETGAISTERIDSSSNVSQTRLTMGFSHDFSRDTKLGVFYRYAFIEATDADDSHTIDGTPAALNSTATAGHSSEIGMRWRSAITQRLFYGVTAAWLGVSLRDGLVRTNAVDSHERDRAQRGSLGLGVGYALTRRVMLSLDLAGGATRTQAARNEDATGNLLQNGTANGHFVSAHAAVQADLTQHLFVSASLLNVWQCHELNVDLFPDRYGQSTLVQDSFFPFNPAAFQAGNHFSDFGVGWRFSRSFFVQYLYSTDYGVTPASHTLMLRYTFHLRRE